MYNYDDEKLFVNTEDSSDVVTLVDIFRRYLQINGTYDGFEDYVNSGFYDGISPEYVEYKN